MKWYMVMIFSHGGKFIHVTGGGGLLPNNFC